MAYIDSGGGAGKGGGGGGFDLSSLGNIGGLLGAGGGLLAGLLGGGNNVPYSANLQGIVGQIGQVGAGAAGESSILSGEGNQLIQPLLTGQLPQGAQDIVNQLVQKQTADTKAKYASLGQTGSTMEQSALNDIQTNKGALTFHIAQQMASTGLQATQQSLSALGIELGADNAQAGIYNNLMNAEMKNNSNMMSSIGSFASAFAKVLPMLAAV